MKREEASPLTTQREPKRPKTEQFEMVDQAAVCMRDIPRDILNIIWDLWLPLHWWHLYPGAVKDLENVGYFEYDSWLVRETSPEKRFRSYLRDNTGPCLNFRTQAIFSGPITCTWERTKAHENFVPMDRYRIKTLTVKNFWFKRSGQFPCISPGNWVFPGRPRIGLSLDQKQIRGSCVCCSWDELGRIFLDEVGTRGYHKGSGHFITVRHKKDSFLFTPEIEIRRISYPDESLNDIPQDVLNIIWNFWLPLHWKHIYPESIKRLREIGYFENGFRYWSEYYGDRTADVGIVYKDDDIFVTNTEGKMRISVEFREGSNSLTKSLRSNYIGLTGPRETDLVLNGKKHIKTPDIMRLCGSVLQDNPIWISDPKLLEPKMIFGDVRSCSWERVKDHTGFGAQYVIRSVAAGVVFYRVTGAAPFWNILYPKEFSKGKRHDQRLQHVSSRSDLADYSVIEVEIPQDLVKFL